MERTGLTTTSRLGVGVGEVLFRSGRISPVYGVALADGRRVSVKVHRRPADMAYLTAAAASQRRLAAAGYPCPVPIDGPSVTDGLTAVTESLLAVGAPGDGHVPHVRRAIVQSLCEHIDILRGVGVGVCVGAGVGVGVRAGVGVGVGVGALSAGGPAWTRYQHGPWPTPHDPIFDFTVTPPAFGWLDAIAARAATVLRGAGPADTVGHADWNCGNLLFLDGRVSTSWDWDSLAAVPEAMLVGTAAAGFTQAGVTAPHTPASGEMAAFVEDYASARGRSFAADERTVAAAAVTWTLAYNARCEVSFLGAGDQPTQGFPLEALTVHGDRFLDLSRY